MLRSLLLAVLLSPFLAAQRSEPIPVLVIGGENNHDVAWTSPSLRTILEESGRFEVTVTTEPAETLADAAGIARFRAFVLDYNGPRWGGTAEANFLKAVRGGTGVTVIHAANNAFPGWVEYEKLVGLCWRGEAGHGRFHPFDVAVVDHYHPITEGMPDLRSHPDELYHRLAHMHGVPLRVLASAWSSPRSGGSGRYEPMVIVRQYGEGRVFHTPLGHVWKGVPRSRASHADPQFRHLVARGTEWAATGKVTLPPSPPNFLTAEEKEAGFRLLFDGRSLEGWRSFGTESPPSTGWEVEHGALVHREGGGGGDLMTVDTFGEFDLRFEWAVAPGSNSGVIYHVATVGNRTYESGPEYQILDDPAHPDAAPAHRAGALYDLVPAEGAELVPTGRWNRGRIVVRGGRVRHWLNGEMVVDAPRRGEAWEALVAASKFDGWPHFGKAERGHIALQDHGDEVRFRSLRIREL